MVTVVDDARRLVPRTDVVLADPRLALAEQRLGRDLVRDAVRRAQQRARDGLIAPDEVIDAAVAGVPPLAASLTPVINATGVLVHPGLGRAPLSAAARDALATAAGTSDLEFDLGTGQRGKRGAAMLAALARAVPDAEAVHVVNSRAAALALVATALGAGREIVAGRGELTEPDDDVRLPELLASTGAAICAVGEGGAQVPVADYAAAIGPRTGFVLAVRPSAARTRGLAALGVPVVGDIESGLLAPHSALPDEPDAASCLQAGAALVVASADALLGGPQAGLLLGRADLVRQLSRHPLARALRVGKLTVAALTATLTGPAAPVLQALSADPQVLAERAQRLAGVLAAAGLDARPVPSQAVVGAGTGATLASAAVSLPESLARPLRAGEQVRAWRQPAVAGQVTGGRLLLDLRAVPPGQDDMLAAAVLAAAVPAAADGR